MVKLSMGACASSIRFYRLDYCEVHIPHDGINGVMTSDSAADYAQLCQIPWLRRHKWPSVWAPRHLRLRGWNVRWQQANIRHPLLRCASTSRRAARVWFCRSREYSTNLACSGRAMWRWQYYFVFLAGRNRRVLTDREQRIQRLVMATTLAVFITFSALVGILVLYLVKSALGIDLIPGFSFGAWGWFKEEFLR